MRNLLLTIACGEKYQALAKITHPLMRAYAERIGAEFMCIDENNRSTPHWEKFQIHGLLNRYDRIIYLDTDILVRGDAPNLFDVVPSNCLGMFDEAPYTNRSRELLIDTCRQYGVTLQHWNGCYYNSGVMVISRIHKPLFKKPELENCSFFEQTYLNMAIARDAWKMHQLDYRLNRMSCMDPYTGEHRLAAWIVHYAGCPSIDFVIDLAQKDALEWEANPGHSYARHVCIHVGGGIGDQINAEPAIRFAREREIFGADSHITVLTHWPRIFRHLADDHLDVYLHGTWTPKPDTPYYQCKSLPEPDSTQWSIVSNLLCHTVDYCSMAILRRVLPSPCKRPILDVTLDDVAELIEVVGIRDLNEFICVHPGRHWESKTFPAAWWQEVIDKLAAAAPVGIIGSNDEPTRGTVDVDVPAGAVDLRDRLTLGAFFAFVKESRVLVSNDSCPIHVAGAFDTGIVLIPTCKHPEHVLPWRNGSVWHNAVAPHKLLMLDDVPSAPTIIGGSRAEKLCRPWDEYLPTPDEVVMATVHLYETRGVRQLTEADFDYA